MVRLLVYGYTTGVRSSRAIEKACTDLVAFRWFAAVGLREDSDFRNAVLQAVLRGLVNALSSGPRATVLWVVALVIEVVLEIIRALNTDQC